MYVMEFDYWLPSLPHKRIWVSAQGYKPVWNVSGARWGYQEGTKAPASWRPSPFGCTTDTARHCLVPEFLQKYIPEKVRRQSKRYWSSSSKSGEDSWSWKNGALPWNTARVWQEGGIVDLPWAPLRFRAHPRARRRRKWSWKAREMENKMENNDWTARMSVILRL